MTRRSDCYVKIDWKGVWDLSIYFEPLLFFVSIPYHIDRPFEAQKKNLLEQFQGSLSEWKLQTNSTMYKGDLLRQFLQCARKIPSV